MMRRAAAGVCVGLLGVVLLAGCGSSSGSGTKVPPGDVAVVDGTGITVAQLVTTMNVAKLSLKGNYPVPGTTDWVSLRSQALSSLTHDAELRAWARNLGVSVMPSAVDAAVKQALASAYPGTTSGSYDQAKVDAAFKSSGMTPALFRHRIETKLLAQAAANKVAGNPTVTTAQITAEYNKDKSTTYALPERRKLRHILVKTKALADQLYAQLSTSDADFAALAKKYSIDGSKAQGGELGISDYKNLVPPFAKVAFSLPVGVVSKPTKSQYGWHLIEAQGPVLKASTQPLDKTVQAQIRSQLVAKAKQKRIAEQFNLAVLALGASIEYAPGYGPPVSTTQ